MKIRLAINGFGRIGRAVTRLLQQSPDLELVAINDLCDPGQLAHALKYDSVYRGFPGKVACEGQNLIINGSTVRVSAHAEPEKLPWQELGVQLVLETTGAFRKRAQLEGHLSAGAEKVLLAVPPKDPIDLTVVMGVNDHLIQGSEKLVSNASCTTNAAAPVTKVLHDAFGIQRGYLNTIHAYTNGQHLIDTPHKDWRRSRAAALSIIPTTTGAAKAVAAVIPDLAGRLDGTAYRVPVPDGSIVDMLFQVSRPVTVEEVNKVLANAASGPLKGIIQYETDPIVSSDILGNGHSGIVDSQLTQVIDGVMVKVAVWYDNEWGYSARMVDMATRLFA